MDLKAFKYDCMPGYAYAIFPHECKNLDCAKSNGVWVYFDNNTPG